MKGIYAIICVVTGRVYCGNSVDIDRRFIEHRNALQGNRHANRRRGKTRPASVHEKAWATRRALLPQRPMVTV